MGGHGGRLGRGCCTPGSHQTACVVARRGDGVTFILSRVTAWPEPLQSGTDEHLGEAAAYRVPAEPELAFDGGRPGAVHTTRSRARSVSAWTAAPLQIVLGPTIRRGRRRREYLPEFPGIRLAFGWRRSPHQLRSLARLGDSFDMVAVPRPSGRC